MQLGQRAPGIGKRPKSGAKGMRGNSRLEVVRKLGAIIWVMEQGVDVVENIPLFDCGFWIGDYGLFCAGVLLPKLL